MPKKLKTPYEVEIEKQLRQLNATAKMDKELAKYGRKTRTGGMVWTVGDMQRYFKKRLKKK